MWCNILHDGGDEMNETDRDVSKVLASVSEEIGGFAGERQPVKEPVVFRAIAELVPKMHQNALDHGWHEGYTGKYEEELTKKMQIIGEASEANDDVAHDRMTLTYRRDGKPEGFPSEIADIVIRVADLLSLTNSSFGAKRIEASVRHGESAKCRPHTVVEVCSYLCEICAAVVKEDWDDALFICGSLSKLVGFNLTEVINIKHAYNKTRSYRHGGKRV